MAFKCISNPDPEQVEYRKRVMREINRLYHLPDRWLAEALLTHAREIRASSPQKLGDPTEPVYGTTLVWHLLPELAYRLGATKFIHGERGDSTLRRASDYSLRCLASLYHRHAALGFYCRADSRPLAVDLLENPVTDGNPMAFAADRISPPDGSDKSDLFASALLERCRHRGMPLSAIWNPGLFAR